MEHPQLHIPVFIEGQDDLADIVATAMHSICYNTSSFINFYILDCGICPFNKKQIELIKKNFDNCSIEFLPIDLHRFDGMKGWPPPKYQFVDCYARLLIPELKPELDKAIYLDSDVIALGDIKELWEQSFDGYVFGATADIGYEGNYYKNCIENLGVRKDNIYPNAGVLLLDCKQWRAQGITEKLLKIGREKKDHLLVLNEDILSIAFNHNNYKLLDNRFNLTDLNSRICKYSAPQITDEYMSEQWKNPIIYHLSHSKPFRQMKNIYNGRTIRHFDSFWFFAKMTPFYAGMKLRFEENRRIVQEESRMVKKDIKEKYRLFNCLPFLTTKTKNNTKRYKLFGFIPFMKKTIK